MTNKNTAIGMDVERLFKNSIRRQRDVLDTLRAYFAIEGEFGTSFSTGTDAGKSDVILRFSDGRSLSVNIKAFKAGFNQVTRSRIETFCRELGLDELVITFQEAAVRVAGKAGRFILSEDESRVLSVLGPLARKILQFSLVRQEGSELLVLYDRSTNTMLLYDMKQLLDNLDCKVSFSNRGIIRIGEYFTIQRKGGNGVHSQNIPKTSLDHPGNNLQVKMNIRKFVRYVAPIITYTP